MGVDLETDEGLAALVAARGHAARAAGHALYDRHARRLLAFLAGRVPAGAVEDVAQEVWQRMWQARPGAFRGGNFRAWLFAIARNCATDSLRRKVATGLPRPDAVADPRRPADEELAEAELRAALAECLEQLGRADARLADLVRARLGGESYDAFCARTGLPADQAYRAFHGAKARLRVCVEGKVGS